MGGGGWRTQLHVAGILIWWYTTMMMLKLQHILSAQRNWLRVSRTLQLQCRAAAICVRPISNTLSSSQGKKTPRSSKHPTSNVFGYKVELYISIGFFFSPVVRATHWTTGKPFYTDSFNQWPFSVIPTQCASLGFLLMIKDYLALIAIFGSN